MSEPVDPPTTPILPYSPPQPGAGVMRLGFASLFLALLGFPIGVGATIALHASGAVSHRVGERGGFTVFAIFEGLAAATGFLAWRKAKGQSRGYLAMTYLAMALGVIGVAIVLLLYIRGALN